MEKIILIETCGYKAKGMIIVGEDIEKELERRYNEMVRSRKKIYWKRTFIDLKNLYASVDDYENLVELRVMKPSFYQKGGKGKWECLV